MFKKAPLALATILGLGLFFPVALMAQDVGEGLLPVHQEVMCDSGLSAAGSCTSVFTNLGTTLVAASPAVIQQINFAPFHHAQLEAQMSVAVVTGDLVVQCDSDSSFASPVVLLQFSIGTGLTTQFSGWFDIASGDADLYDVSGCYCRLAMDEGNTTEDPRVAYAHLHLR